MAVNELDQQLIRVPAEQLSIACRAHHRRTEKELAAILDDVQQLGAAGAARTLGAEHARAQIGLLVGRLHGLKRKLEEGQAEQDAHLERCKARLSSLSLLVPGGAPAAEHTASAPLTPAEATADAGAAQHAERTSRLIADYLYRAGLTQSAGALAAGAGVSPLLDSAMYEQSARIAATLRLRECAPALSWAAEHRARLRRQQSDLEFRLRLQDFIERVRAGERGAAICYARAHFPAHAASHMPQIQQAMATTAFATVAGASRAYSRLFDEAAWTSLERQFAREHRALNCAPERPPLLLALGAGLSALRNEACDDCQAGDDDEEELEDAEPDGDGARARACERAGARPCPACSAELRPLCARLPRAHHTRSSLLCALSGAPMDEDNPPYALPSGRLISARALRGAIDSSGRGREDPEPGESGPRSGERFHPADVRKVFIV